MFRASSEAIPASRDVVPEVPFVLRLDLSRVDSAASTIVGTPISCYKCGAFVEDVAEIKEDPKVGKHFVCRFCGTLNIVKDEIIIAGPDTEIVISEPEKPEEETTVEGQDLKMGSLLAVIDVSGSMQGANLAAVKRSLLGTLNSLASNSPATKFGLITFSTEVSIVDMIGGKVHTVPPGAYNSIDALIKEAKRISDGVRLVKVGENIESLRKQVNSLYAQASTALGPAVVTAYAMAEMKGIDRVIVLTDGLANEGIGSFEAVQVPPASEFYSKMGDMFRESGTVVDIVGIESGSGMELRTLGSMPLATGGQMFLVTPSELDRSLAELGGRRVLGRDAVVRLISHPSIRVEDVAGVSRAIESELRESREARLAGITEDTELYLSVAPESKIDADEVPVQIQVEYTAPDGSRRMRVMTKKFKVARKKEDVLKSLDPEIPAAFAVQKAGEESFLGATDAAQSRLQNLEVFFEEQAKVRPAAAAKRFKKAARVIGQERFTLEEEVQAAAAPSAAPQARDAFSVAQMARMRKKSDDLFKDDAGESEEEEE